MNILDQIVSTVIRPTRDIYSASDLGAKKFLLEGNNGILLQVERTDEIILNTYGQKIHLSHYKVSKKSQDQNNKDKSDNPTLVFVHANNGSRMEGQQYLKFLFQNMIDVVLFDCTGSGLSDGEFITLGMKEADDLHAVIEHIVINKKLANISLWGRSMGAVTVLLYASCSRRPIKCCIFDSPFANLKRLVKQIGLTKTGLPQFFLNPLLNVIENSVQEKIKCKVFDINPLEQAKKIISPGLFITSKTDKLVNSLHVEELYKQYRAKKQLMYISQQHHQPRDRNTIEACIKFILTHTQQPFLKMYQSQYIPRQHQYNPKTERNQKNLGEFGNSIKMKQSMMIHSTSQQQFARQEYEEEVSKFRKNERKSLADKISVSAFRKNSLKLKEIKKLQCKNLGESKVGNFGNQESKQTFVAENKPYFRFEGFEKKVKKVEIPK